MPNPPEGATAAQTYKYKDIVSKWEKDYEQWRHITCPCGRGYFDRQGVWISGADVRDGKHEPNPDWSNTNGFAPKSKDRKYTGMLHERWESSDVAEACSSSQYVAPGSFRNVPYDGDASFQKEISQSEGTSYEDDRSYETIGNYSLGNHISYENEHLYDTSQN